VVPSMWRVLYKPAGDSPSVTIHTVHKYCTLPPGDNSIAVNKYYYYYYYYKHFAQQKPFITHSDLLHKRHRAYMDKYPKFQHRKMMQFTADSSHLTQSVFPYALDTD
jgi:hypothetical protein